MCEAKDFPPSERDELMGLVTQLQGQVAQLTAANEELHEQVAELKRAGKRQAAPFSKGGRSSRPKRPGRKPGMGSFSYRKSPSPDEVTEPLVEVAVAEDTYPGCGGRLEQHCSKNAGGADAFSAFISVIRTLARNGGDHSLVNGPAVCSAVLRSPPLPSEPLLALRSANQLLAMY